MYGISMSLIQNTSVNAKSVLTWNFFRFYNFLDGGAGVCIPGRLKVTGKESLFCWRTGKLLLDGGSEQLSYTITDMGERGEHSIRDWRDSAKYLDTTLPLEEFFKKNTC